MLTENDVVTAVEAHIKTLGWTDVTTLTTEQRGIDIIARRPDSSRRLLIEAKGGTSSKKHTERFGKPFTNNQAGSHVARAFYCAVKMRDANEGDLIAIAFPDDNSHQKRVEAIQMSLSQLNIAVFFVGSDKTVSSQLPWRQDLL